MTSSVNEWELNTFSKAAHEYRYLFRFNPIPFDTRVNRPTGGYKWTEYQDGISDDKHKEWETNNTFDNGIAIILGKARYRKGFPECFVFAIDLDGKSAIEQFCLREDGSKTTLEQLSKIFKVDQHSDDPHSVHIIGYSTKQLKTKYVITKPHKDPKLTEKIEVKASKGFLINISPSFHKNGTQWARIGEEKVPDIIDVGQMEKHLIEVFKRNGSDYLSSTAASNAAEAISREQDPVLDSPDVVWELGAKVREELSKHIFSISCYEPMAFVIAHRGLNQIINAYLGNEKVPDLDSDGKLQYDDKAIVTKTVRVLRLKNPIINAIPAFVKKYDDGIHSEYKYEIQFNTNIENKTFTTQANTIEGITQELKDKGMVLGREAETALTHILIAMEGSKSKSKNFEISKNIENKGFYIVDNKLVSYGVSTKNPSSEEIKECIEFIEELEKKFKIKNVLPTALKWAICAPFSYAMKSYNNWLPWIHSYGFTRSGKTTEGRIVLALWRLEELKANISFESINTSARFGHNISQTTFPIVINEVGALSDERHGDIVEMMKHAVESKTARGKFTSKDRYNTTPALSPCILTGNPSPPHDTAYRRKVIPIRHTVKDCYEEEEIKDFNNWFEPRKQVLGILGDFAVNYIMNKPEILQKAWSDIGLELLSEFYAMGTMGTVIEIPKWANELVEQNEIVESLDDSFIILRSFLTAAINDAYTRHAGRLRDEQKNLILLESKLEACCEQSLIPFIERSDDEYLITQSIMHELRKNKLEGYTGGSLKGLAEILGFEYGNKRVGGKQMKVAYCNIGKMMGLLGDAT